MSGTDPNVVLMPLVCGSGEQARTSAALCAETGRRGSGACADSRTTRTCRPSDRAAGGSLVPPYRLVWRVQGTRTMISRAAPGTPAAGCENQTIASRIRTRGRAIHALEFDLYCGERFEIGAALLAHVRHQCPRELGTACRCGVVWHVDAEHHSDEVVEDREQPRPLEVQDLGCHRWTTARTDRVAQRELRKARAVSAAPTVHRRWRGGQGLGRSQRASRGCGWRLDPSFDVGCGRASSC